MVDIPVQGAHGAFDDLHGCGSGRKFSECLARRVDKHYGHAGPAFVRALIQGNPDLDENLAKAMAHFAHGENPMQARVARTFATLAVAGQLARHYGIVPWEESVALNACKTLFDHWKAQLKSSGAETPEAKICALVATFISRFSESRFSNVGGSGPKDPKINDRAGYWKDIHGGPRIYLFQSDALQDACKGYDIGEITKALDAAGALSEKQGDGHLSKRTRTPHGTNPWLYYVNPDALEK
jgi:putative DNA primase/helicase